jgi:hypothetical protein
MVFTERLMIEQKRLSKEVGSAALIGWGKRLQNTGKKEAEIKQKGVYIKIIQLSPIFQRNCP